MTNTDKLKQQILNLIMEMDNEQALEILHDVVQKFSNPSSVAEDELTDEEWGEIENDIKEIEDEETGRQQEVAEHLK